MKKKELLNIKLSSTKLVQNIKELQCRADEHELEKQIYNEVKNYVNKDIDAIYLTQKILSIIRLYKF